MMIMMNACSNQTNVDGHRGHLEHLVGYLSFPQQQDLPLQLGGTRNFEFFSLYFARTQKTSKMTYERTCYARVPALDL
jgi:hypothetical protein